MRKRYSTLALAIFIIGLSSIAVSEEATPYEEDRYAPTRLGVPETLGGYPVLAVMTNDNTMCMRPGETRLVLQAPQPTIEDALFDFSTERIKQELEELNLAEYLQWGWEIVGPGATQEQLISQLEQSYRFFKAHGCTTLELSKTTNSAISQAGGENKNPDPFPGFALIQNLAVGNSNNNAQSVILVAPVVGNNQYTWFSCERNKMPPPRFLCGLKGGSAFLNNGLTDKGYFLQVGLFFPSTFSGGGEGQVIWTDDTHGLKAQTFSIKYTAGHHYYTTVTYTSGTWWTCAADVADIATYNCVEHPEATAIGSTYLTNTKKVGTSIFAENWNRDKLWYYGFSEQWDAYGATTYITGEGHLWTAGSEAQWTLDSCTDAWPPENAIGGSLVGGGTAHFKTKGIPPYCEGASPEQVAPNAPSDISVFMTSGGHGIGVSWKDNSNNELGFDIFNGVMHLQVGPDQTFISSDWGGLSSGQNMCFQVSAYNAAGYSAPTPWACITVP